jgi:hypothetical protein
MLFAGAIVTATSKKRRFLKFQHATSEAVYLLKNISITAKQIGISIRFCDLTARPTME